MLTKYRLSLLGLGTLAAVVLLAGFFLGIQPQLSRIATANEQQAAAEAINREQEATNAALRADQEKIGEYNAQLAQKQALIPNGRSQQELIAQIDAAAFLAGVAVENVTFEAPMPFVAPAGVPLTPTASGALVSVGTTITVTGERINLEQFAWNLQNNGRLITVAQSQYSGPEAASLTVTGSTWVLQPRA